MDRNSIMGLLLIAGIVITFSVLNMPSQEDLDAQKRLSDSLARVDSINNLSKKIVVENQNAVVDSSAWDRKAAEVLKGHNTKSVDQNRFFAG